MIRKILILYLVLLTINPSQISAGDDEKKYVEPLQYIKVQIPSKTAAGRNEEWQIKIDHEANLADISRYRHKIGDWQVVATIFKFAKFPESIFRDDKYPKDKLLNLAQKFELCRAQGASDTAPEVLEQIEVEKELIAKVKSQRRAMASFILGAASRRA